MRKRKILVFSNLQNSVARMLQQRKKVIFSPLENRKNKKEKQNMGTQQQSISSRKKWDIQRGKTAPRKWELPENRSKSRKWGLPDPTAVFMATFRENAKVDHDHQTPENSEPVKRREIRPNEPTAFCHNCQEMTPMVWLPKEERGKNCDTWFKCEFCGGRHLTIKYITEKEAVAKNKLAKEAEDL